MFTIFLQNQLVFLQANENIALAFYLYLHHILFALFYATFSSLSITISAHSIRNRGGNISQNCKNHFQYFCCLFPRWLGCVHIFKALEAHLYNAYSIFNLPFSLYCLFISRIYCLSLSAYIYRMLIRKETDNIFNMSERVAYLRK